ncbi:MAG: Fic/DOC family protein [Bacteroidetes bacterium B1(2017)]|nr:MAG: Fic/DOC family protein [Bacteroidetes bacterium B1(2017)]
MKPYDRNKPFNELPLLPPSVSILTTDILLSWGKASRSLAELNKNLLRLPNPIMLINTISIQEARSSTEIENIFTTEDELYKAISDDLMEEGLNPNIIEVLRYREALWAGYLNMKKKNEINLSTIVKINQQIKNNKQAIRSPQSQIIFKRGQSEFRSGETIYTPPRGKGVVEKKINNLVDYLNQEYADDIDPLLKMTIAHYQFEAIHPFSDGNGRTGRILNLIYLVKEGLLAQPVLYFSKYIIENKEDYYHFLAGVTQRKDWKSWILFMLEGIRQTAGFTNNLIDEILSQVDATLEYGKKELKWYTKELNEVIFSQPYIKPSLVGEVLSKNSRTTLTKYMQDLCKKGILSRKQIGKEVYYLNHDLIRILEQK